MRNTKYSVYKEDQLPQGTMCVKLSSMDENTREEKKETIFLQQAVSDAELCMQLLELVREHSNDLYHVSELRVFVNPQVSLKQTGSFNW